MKMKLYYVVKDNPETEHYCSDVIYVPRPFGTLGEAYAERESGETYVVEQEIQVD